MKNSIALLVLLCTLLAVRPISAQQRAIDVTVNPSAGGSVTGAGRYNNKATVTLVATAASGYAFGHWSEDSAWVSNTNPYSFTMDKSRILVAHFKKIFVIATTAMQPEGGAVTGAGNFFYNDSVKLKATAAGGYDFTGWLEGGKTVSTDSTYKFTVKTNRTLVARFKKRFTITATLSYTDNGTVTGAGIYYYNDTVTLKAIPASGCDFISWNEAGKPVSTTATYKFTVTKNRNLVAVCKKRFAITASVYPEGSGTVTGAGTYYYNDSVTLKATPGSGHQFDRWKEGATVVSMSSTYKFPVTKNRTLVANFKIASIKH